MSHHNFMRMAINLAKKNIGNTGVNPSVACLIEKDNCVLTIGTTGNSGRPHAEYNAIKNTKKNLKGSTAYVTLEPCSHEEETPSCARILAEAGVAKVVSPLADPNPIVNGKGFEMLKNYGVTVQIDDYYKREAYKIIEGFAKRITTGKPYVTLKLAMSLDGKIALSSGESKWISGVASRRHTHLLRYRSDAIMVGSNTVLQDNPSLNIREKFFFQKQPIRILLDSSSGLDAEGNIFQTMKTQKTIIFSQYERSAKLVSWEKAGAKVIKVNKGANGLDINSILKKIGSLGISNLLVEGGSALSGSLIEGNFVDRIITFYCGKVFGHSGISAISKLDSNRTSINDFPNFFIEETTKYDNDLMISWVKRP